MDDPVELLRRAYGQVTATVRSLSPAEFRSPTSATAWCVQDLLFHLLLDAQRALVGYASPSDAPADVDAVTYWRPFRPDVDPDAAAAHARFVSRASRAYGSPDSLVRQWDDTATAAVRAAGSSPPGGRITTQGHVLTGIDFADTLAVEACVHQLDLIAHVHDQPPPDPDLLRHTRAVLESIAGADLPAQWSDRYAVLLGTGRCEPTDRDRRLGADVIDRLPLLG